MRRFVHGETGIALFMVLWVLTLLSVMVAEYSFTVRTALRFTRNHKEDLQASYIARAGVYTAISGLIDTRGRAGTPPGSGVYGFPEGVPFLVGVEMPPLAAAGGEVILEVNSEGGKININHAGLKALDWLLRPLELEEDRRRIILDSILDWRDSDDLHRMDGAENAYYQSLAEPYAAKNGDFDSPDELLLVRGITPEIFEAIRSSITVYPKNEANGDTVGTARGNDSRFDKLDVNSVGPELLSSIPGMTDEDVRAILEFRAAGPVLSIGQITGLVKEDVRVNLPFYLGIQDVPVYSIRATGMLDAVHAVRRTIDAVVEIDILNPQRRFHILEWREPVAISDGFA